MAKIASYIGRGLKFSDEVLTSTQRAVINSRIAQFWGDALSDSRRAEAFATESAILRYEERGYELLYAQRAGLRNGVHGPDVIMKHKDTGEALIIEAKGSYTTRNIAEAHDGKRAGVRLASKVDGQYRLYLSRDWLDANKESRYLLRLLKGDQKEQEAGRLILDILDNGENYKAAIVFGGINNASTYWGRHIDTFIEQILTDVNTLDMVKIR